jgi:hypothetical protein
LSLEELLAVSVMVGEWPVLEDLFASTTHRVVAGCVEPDGADIDDDLHALLRPNRKPREIGVPDPPALGVAQDRVVGRVSRGMH